MLRSPVHDRYFANRCDRVDSLICSVHCLCLSFISCSRCSIQLTRPRYLYLNGKATFEASFGKSGIHVAAEPSIASLVGSCNLKEDETYQPKQKSESQVKPSGFGNTPLAHTLPGLSWELPYVIKSNERESRGIW
ncbi:hypothetical protein CFP56_011403 [Quercus suber]|uniref:Uncharacterized protein n=1 Tax=Quercus suber TaxID=58331 RepID=A0AAW0MHX9_QUESU